MSYSKVKTVRAKYNTIYIGMKNIARVISLM